MNCMSPHLYADDAQVYGSCPPSARFHRRFPSLSMTSLTSWASSNRLQLNPAKAESLWCATISPRQHQLPLITALLFASVYTAFLLLQQNPFVTWAFTLTQTRVCGRMYRVGQKSKPLLICYASYVRKALLFCMHTNLGTTAYYIKLFAVLLVLNILWFSVAV